jgi:hypothetical protein
MDEAQATFFGGIATLVTGIAAVVAAANVGVRQARIQDRQAGISERQNRILDRQAALAELTLRHDLFEKRFDVYRATREFLIETLSHGFPSENASLSTEKRAFLAAKDKATFLFRPAVTASLREIWDKFVSGVALDARFNGPPIDNEAEFMNLHVEQTANMLWFGERLDNLAELFGNELRLSDYDMQLG